MRSSSPTKYDGPAQFRATPRFGFSSLASKRRGLKAARNIAEGSRLPAAAPPSVSSLDDAVDLIQDESFSIASASTSPAKPAALDTQDTIDAESPASCSQAEIITETPIKHERASKRRRISISSRSSSPATNTASPLAYRCAPQLDVSSPQCSDGGHDYLDSDCEMRNDSDVAGNEAPSANVLTLSQELRAVGALRERRKGDHFRSKVPSNTGIGDAASGAFRTAPRFVPVERPEHSPGIDDHHDVFSPPRRGEKYIRGGLAAELGQWIAGTLNSSGAGKLYSIHEVEDTGEVLLARASPTSTHVESTSERELPTGNSRQRGTQVNLILGGPRKSGGLIEGQSLNPRDSVIVAQPVWDVDIHGNRWKVACNWRAVDG